MVKTGAVIFDVGINRVEDEHSKSGSRLVGDVDTDQVKDSLLDNPCARRNWIDDNRGTYEKYFKGL